MGVELEIQDMAFDSLIPAVQSGKADFTAAGMTVNEDRKKNVDFTDTYAQKLLRSLLLKKEARSKHRMI